MHKKAVIVLTIVLVLVGFVAADTVSKNYKNREGKILISSESITDLQNKIPYPPELSATSCKWYQQIRKKSGIFFISTYSCFDGEIVLEDKYFKSIVSGYKWEEYFFSNVPLNEINEDIYGVKEMYKSSMIQDSLRTKKLYTCEEYDNSFSAVVFHSFLDKENKTLYFYYLQI